MPQLYPMNWIFLCSIFILMIFTLMIFSYFSPFYFLKSSISFFQHFQKNWKW
uniref:ATP synthase F0 subunit 8 n=1 Tax=Ornithodoros sonrai TaxID=352064 RepID=A0A3G2JZY7_9ACAR|nr:ATP synthase F0 subunit 8 [Ornithodoros sonrai]AYN50614.1 ATP synthase F0 subunit 8 [Ornithodoros sonrai]